MKPVKWRKKPVVIEAAQLTKDNVREIARWCGGRAVFETKPGDPTDVYVGLDIPTLEGAMRADAVHSSTFRNGKNQALLIQQLKAYKKVIGAQYAGQAAYEAAYLTDDHTDWMNHASAEEIKFWNRAAEAAISFYKMEQNDRL